MTQLITHKGANLRSASQSFYYAKMSSLRKLPLISWEDNTTVEFFQSTSPASRKRSMESMRVSFNGR